MRVNPYPRGRPIQLIPTQKLIEKYAGVSPKNRGFGCRILQKGKSPKNDYWHLTAKMEEEEMWKKALSYLQEHGTIKRGEYVKLLNCSARIAAYDLGELVDKNIIVRVGKTGKCVHYVLKKFNVQSNVQSKGS